MDQRKEEDKCTRRKIVKEAYAGDIIWRIRSKEFSGHRRYPVAPARSFQLEGIPRTFALGASSRVRQVDGWVKAQTQFI